MRCDVAFFVADHIITSQACNITQLQLSSAMLSEASIWYMYNLISPNMMLQCIQHMGFYETYMYGRDVLRMSTHPHTTESDTTVLHPIFFFGELLYIP